MPIKAATEIVKDSLKDSLGVNGVTVGLNGVSETMQVVTNNTPDWTGCLQNISIALSILFTLYSFYRNIRKDRREREKADSENKRRSETVQSSPTVHNNALQEVGDS